MTTDFPTAPLAPGHKGAGGGAVEKSHHASHTKNLTLPVMLPSSGKKSDAIAVSLNHRDNYSVVVLFAYSIEDGKYVPGEVFAQQGENDVFK